MKKIQLAFSLLSGLSFLGFTFKNNKDEAKDYLNIPGPLTFEKMDYNFVWSSHPSENYYKQEYIPKGDNVENFTKMVLIDAIVSDSLKVEDAVTAKVSELETRKKTDAV